MINTKADFKIINQESADKYIGSDRDRISDVDYLCLKCTRHLAALALGKTHDPDTGVHEMSKIQWYIEKLHILFEN